LTAIYTSHKSSERTFTHTCRIPEPVKKTPKLYRNPISRAMELREIMEREGLTKAELARRMGSTVAPHPRGLYEKSLLLKAGFFRMLPP